MKLILLVLTTLTCQIWARTPAAEATVTHGLAITISIGGETIQQEMMMGMFGDATPKTVDNFTQLCTKEDLKSETSGRELTYKGSPFHRVIPNFMVQGGDFTNRNGTGGESIFGPKFADENFDVAHAKNVLSMANSGPNTNGSQFFITTAETPWLDGRHTVFGRLLTGKTTLTKIEAEGSSSGKPKRNLIFEGCRMLSADELAEALRNERK